MGWVVILSALATLFIFSKECKEGCVNGILLCLGVLIPSLFPFFILSSLIAESNATAFLSQPFGRAFSFITGMSRNAIVPVIMSLVGGYPVGAKTVAQMYRSGKLSKDDTKKLSVVCCCSGPGFLITFIGISLLESKEAGLILLSSQITSIIALLLICPLIFGRNRKTEPTDNILNKSVSFSELLVNSVNTSVKSTAGMCGFVILFSTLCEVLKSFPFMHGNTAAIVMSLFEITTGLTAKDTSLSLEIISALAGFGGICVHLQIFRELKGIEFSKTKFYLFRFIQSAVSLAITKLLLLIFPVSVSVFSTLNDKPQVIFYSNVTGCLILVLTSVLFILSIRKKHQF